LDFHQQLPIFSCLSARTSPFRWPSSAPPPWRRLVTRRPNHDFSPVFCRMSTGAFSFPSAARDVCFLRAPPPLTLPLPVDRFPSHIFCRSPNRSTRNPGFLFSEFSFPSKLSVSPPQADRCVCSRHLPQQFGLPALQFTGDFSDTKTRFALLALLYRCSRTCPFASRGPHLPSVVVSTPRIFAKATRPKAR